MIPRHAATGLYVWYAKGEGKRIHISPGAPWVFSVLRSLTSPLSSVLREIIVVSIRHWAHTGYGISNPRTAQREEHFMSFKTWNNTCPVHCCFHSFRESNSSSLCSYLRTSTRDTPSSLQLCDLLQPPLPVVVFPSRLSKKDCPTPPCHRKHRATEDK